MSLHSGADQENIDGQIECHASHTDYLTYSPEIQGGDLNKDMDRYTILYEQYTEVWIRAADNC